ncbi:response regulator transcription factor [Methylobacterium tarhaniae]|uniref:response regulator transcription factor n=1 Tax=Methylobacterium tarhaniae TaxID=1187852 RepID=UPI00069E27C6|nr:response regulator transcription factor [Methylobacterium tarhaniae]
MQSARSQKDTSSYIQDRGLFLVIDEHAFSRGCTAEVLRNAFPDIEVLGLRRAGEVDRALVPRVIFVALRWDSHPSKGLALGQVLGEVEALFARTPKVLITQLDDESNVQAAIRHGIDGVIPSAASIEIGIAAVRLILAGGTYYPRPMEPAMRLRADTAPLKVVPEPVIPGHAALQPQPEISEGDQVHFTPREIQVLGVLQRGRSNKRIANDLNLSENTVKIYVRHIMRKLKASNRTQAAIMGQRLLPDLAVSAGDVRVSTARIVREETNVRRLPLPRR